MVDFPPQKGHGAISSATLLLLIISFTLNPVVRGTCAPRAKALGMLIQCGPQGLL